MRGAYLMPGKKIKKVDGIGQKLLDQAIADFMRHCRLKNLAEATMEYYQEDLEYFQRITQLKYVNEITREVMDNFVDHEMNKGNRVSAINTRIRGLRVFFNYCAEYGFIHGFKYPLIREDESVKVPYTNEELQRLLRRPETDRWTDWRCWAIINTFVATGIRANTLVNIRIKDVDFDQNTIFLQRLKTRKQMFVPMSKALKDVLILYLKLWDWDGDDYLFPTGNNTQLTVHSLQSLVRHYNLTRKVTKTSLHLFRHTFAKNYIMAGGGMAQLQMILGHSTMDMTRRYVHLYGNDISRDFDKLNPLNNITMKSVEA